MNAAMDSGACPGYEAKLEDYVGGQLSNAEVKQVAEHLKSCGACSAGVDDAAASMRLLRLAESMGEPRPGFARIVVARIRSEREASREGRGLWQPFISLAWRFAATATLALAVMVTYDVAQHARAAQPNTGSARATEVRDLFTAEADRVPVNRDDVLLMVAEADHGKR
jgi:anti-sigma factor RsiW